MTINECHLNRRSAAHDFEKCLTSAPMAQIKAWTKRDFAHLRSRGESDETD